MIVGAWSFLDAFDADAPMVLRGADVLTSRDVMSEAARLRSRLAAGDGSVFLYCEDAGNFLAGLLGILSAGREVVLPGHAAPGYLQGPVVGTVSHQHIYGLLFRVFWPLMAGKPIFAQQLEFWEQVCHYAVPGYSIVSSPAHLSRISENLLVKNPPRHIFSSGGLLPFAAAQSAREKFDVLPIEILGSTETGGVARRQQAIEGERWTPLPDAEISASEEGALQVRSPFTGEAGFVTMGDSVSIDDDGRFALHARLDRIVKVEGKRVSLPHVEEMMRKHLDLLDVSVVDLPDRGHALGAVVVPGDDAKRQLEDVGSFRFSRELRQLLAAHLEPMERPKFWRFLSSIPENAQGKRTVDSLRGLFAQERMELPRIVARDVEADEARFEMVLEPELLWFDGHFPGRPVLPGVAQLHIASMLAEEVWGFVADGHEMARIKFRRMLLPGDRIVLQLSRKATGNLAFSYMVDGDTAASGTFKGVDA